MGKQALDAPRGESMFKFDPTDLTLIGLDTDDGPEHELYDKRVNEPADMALVHDILDQGILEPVIVRKNGSSTEVLAGRRRVKAARKANELLEARYEQGETPEDKRVYVRVPAIRRTGDAKSALKVLISENANREGLDPLAEAQLVQRAIDRGFTEEECATAFGCNRQTIKNRLALNGAIGAVKDAVRSGTLNATAAMKLAALDREEQKDALEALLAEGPVTSAAAARAARQRKAKKNGKAETENSYPVPGKRLLRKITEHENAAEAIDANALLAIRWVLGDLPASRIKGLSALVASIEEPEE